MSVTFSHDFDKNSTTDASTVYGYYDNGDTGKLELVINMNRWTSLENRTHELTHAVMLANMNCYLFESLPGFVKEGLGELTGGVKDRWEDYIKELAASPSTFESNLSVSKTDSGFLNQESGFIFFRYLARLSGDLSIENTTGNTTVQSFYGTDTVRNRDWDIKKVTVLSGAGDDVIDNIGAYSTLDGGDGDDFINNDNYYEKANKVTIDGGAGNDYIANYGTKATLDGGAGNDELHGGDGKDLIYGGSGNDSLWGDAGNDTFVYTANEGTDRIMDYESGDILQILNADESDGAFKSSKYSGGNLTLTINGGGKVVFDDVSKSDTFNINGTSYKISGSKLKKQ